jgi:hypothetical protein
MQMRHVNYTEKHAYATKIGDNWMRRIMDHFFSLPWEGETAEAILAF